jgi:hypothetical protein
MVLFKSSNLSQHHWSDITKASLLSFYIMCLALDLAFCRENGRYWLLNDAVLLGDIYRNFCLLLASKTHQESVMQIWTKQALKTTFHKQSRFKAVVGPVQSIILGPRVFNFFKKILLHNLLLSQAFEAGIQCITSAFGVEPRKMLSIIQRFGKHCSCHSQGECVVVGRILSALYSSFTYCVSFGQSGQFLLTYLWNIRIRKALI